MKSYRYQILLILTLILTSCQDELKLNNLENSQPKADSRKNCTKWTV